MKIKKLLALTLSLILVMSALPYSIGVAATINIPDDAIEFNGHYYKIYDINTTWEDAKLYCESIGGHLITITSAEEQNFLYSIVKVFFKKSYLYIGLSDTKNEGIWKWVTGETLSFSNWAKDQPDDNAVGGTNNQDYGAIKCGSSDEYCYLGQWDDVGTLGGTTSEIPRDRGFICEWESKNTNTDISKTYSSLEQYITDIIIDNNYNGCLNNLNGNTPQNFTYNYLMNPKQVSLSRVYVDLLYQDADFINDVTNWELLTFSPTDVYENYLDEVGYYEAVIMNILNCAVEYSIIPSSVKDAEKTLSGIAGSVIKVLKTDADITRDKLLNQPWNDFGETAQLAAMEAAGKKCVSLKKISDYKSDFFDILSTTATVREFCEKLASLEQIAKLDEYVNTVLNKMYSLCPSSNSALKTAINEVKSVCKSTLDKYAVESINAVVTLGKIVLDETIEEAWDECIMVVGNGLGTGILIGQLIGTTLSNFLFSTDATIEQFYVMRALVNCETLLINTIKDFENRYRISESIEDANSFLTSLKMLIGSYNLSCDYAKDFTETVKTKGLINGIKSIFNFGNEQEYAAYCETCKSMKSSLSSFEKSLTYIDFSYANALYNDDKSLYSEYKNSEKNTNNLFWQSTIITVACPTNVDIYNGEQKLVSVNNNQLTGIIPGVIVYIENDVKNIVLSSDSNYTIKINGFDNGTMDYIVSDYSNGDFSKDIMYDDVPIITDSSYNSDISNESIILTDDNNNILTPDFDSSSLKILDVSLALEENFKLKYAVDKKLFEEICYNEPYVVFSTECTQSLVEEYTQNDNYYIFECILSNDYLKKDITANLYSSFGNGKYKSTDFIINAYQLGVSSCDMNTDSTVDVRDLVKLKKYTAGIQNDNFNENADPDSNGELNSLDLTFLRKFLLLF